MATPISFAVALVLAIPPPIDSPVRAGGRLPPVDLGDPAELAPPMTPATSAAQRLADGGRHAEAAAAWEALWRELGDVRFVYQAGTARARAGQNALAIQRYRTWLERAQGIADATRNYVMQRLAMAEAQTVKIRVGASEAIGGGRRPVSVDRLAQATLRLEPATAGGPSDPGSAITLANYRGEDVAVDRVPIVVHLAIPGYLPVSTLRSPGGDGETWDVAVTRQKVPVTLRFFPTNALRSARLQISPTDGAATGSVDQALENPVTTVMLTTGSWQIDVTSRRHEAHVGMVVAPGMRPLEIGLRKPGKGGGSGGGGGRVRLRDEFDRGEAVTVAFGVSFVALALSGLGVAIAGTVKNNQARRRNEAATDDAIRMSSAAGSTTTAVAALEEAYATERLHADVGRAYTLSTAGGIVALASVGASIAGLTMQERLRRRAALIEVGVGAAFVGGGAAWLAYGLQRQKELLGPTEPTDRVTWGALRSLGGHRAGAVVLLGLGAGLVVFPAVALIADTARKRRRGGYSAVPALGRGHVGIVIRGQF